MAKFCLLAESILPKCLQKRLIVEKERVVCLHGMCKVPKHIYTLKTHVNLLFPFQKLQKEECEAKKLGKNLQIVQNYLEKLPWLNHKEIPRYHQKPQSTGLVESLCFCPYLCLSQPGKKCKQTTFYHSLYSKFLGLNHRYFSILQAKLTYRKYVDR